MTTVSTSTENTINVIAALAQAFRIPDTSAFEQALEDAQNVYEKAKRDEVDAAFNAVTSKLSRSVEWERAVSRTIERSRLLAKPGDKELSRTGAEKLADLDPDWIAYEAGLAGLEAIKRDAESRHSIAYQRLETLRVVLSARSR